MPTTNQHILYLFPGQGAQYQSMGSDLWQDYAVAKSIYEQASDVLGFDVAKLSFHDPKEQLNLTRFTQPTLLTHSIACLEVFKELTDKQVTPLMAAGHSLGEYSALVAAGVLTLENALRLVQKRGELMGTYGEGEMLAFPLEPDAIRPLAEKHYCAIAGYNLQDQTVVGGQSADLDLLAQEALTLFPRKRPIRLKTEGAFHTYFMVNAAQHFRPILGAAEIAAPAIKVLSNYTGDYHTSDAASIRSRLFFQLFHPVLWFKNIQQALADGVTTVIEFGGGIGSGEAPASKRPNLEGIIKKTLRSTGYDVQYLAAINSQTLRETAEIWCSD